MRMQFLTNSQRWKKGRRWVYNCEKPSLNFFCLYPMTVNQKQVDSEHVLSSISEMTSVISSGIPKRKFQIYSLHSTDADKCKFPITKFCQKLIKTVWK
jgi:hypothetical protein